MAVSFHKFIDRLNRSGLLSPGRLQSLLADTPNDERPGSAEDLARWLVKRGHLTPFQAKAIFIGHTRGLIVGNYIILDLIGVGGMGHVYKAQHQRMKRIVALKLLSPEVAKKPKLVERFHQEVEAAARLMHPNIVTAFDADEADGKHFLVMEYVYGQDLATLIKRRGWLSVDRSIRCLLDAARGLDYAHRNGVIHRDVKPSNLLLTTTDGDSALDSPTAQVKILDMGLARIDVEEEGLNKPSDLTRTGVVMGTVDYMSPEQAVNTHHADHRSDIYSLGITLFFLVTGRIPFTGSTVIEQVLAHREGPIPSLRQARREVPQALDAIFQKMVAKRREDRYQSMADVVTALEDLQSTGESATDVPIIMESRDDEDSALVNFLDSMAGDPAKRQQAAASVITPASTGESASDTIISSDRSTAIGRWQRSRGRGRRPIPWGAIALHCTWSMALLGGAIWILMASRDKVENAGPNDGEATVQETDTTEGDAVDGTSGPDAVDAAGETMAARTDRRLAMWILSKGGSLVVSDSARSEHILPGEELPQWAISITTINLPGSTITADDLEALGEISNLEMLRTLVLADCPVISNEWIGSLQPFTVLSQLNLRGTAVTDASLAALPKICPTLEILNLGGCAVDGSGLEPLAELSLLRHLELNASPLTASALPHLTGLTSLRTLDLRNTPLTPQQIAQIKRSLSECHVQY